MTTAPTARIDLDVVDPALVKAVTHLDNTATRALRAVGFPEGQAHLLRLRASQVNGCAYCVDMHTKDAFAAGESPERIAALPVWRETPFFNDRERSELAFAEAFVTLASGRMPDAVFADLAAHHTEPEIAAVIGLLLAIDAWNGLGVTNPSLDRRQLSTRRRRGRLRSRQAAGRAARALTHGFVVAERHSSAFVISVTPPPTRAYADPMRSAAQLEASQKVRFCTSSDGVRIAYAVHGQGPPVVLDACWLSHLEFDWRSPVWRHYLVGLGQVATVVRFDERGHGMSDRDVTDFSIARRVDDLAAVVDDAGLDRFALVAMAQGGPVSLHYIHANPGRVTRFVCASTHAAPHLHVTDDDRDLEAAFGAMIRAGWDRKDPLFRRVFTTMMIPDATEEQMAWVDDLFQRAVSARTAYAARVERRQADASRLLASIDVPTLVTHSRHERMISFEHGRTLAAGIPGARLVPLESNNHILLEAEPAWQVFLREVTGFLAQDAAAPALRPADLSALSAREVEVLREAARGLDNASIAAGLHLSVRTVERHLQRVYAKLGLAGPAARAGAVASLLGAPSDTR